MATTITYKGSDLTSFSNASKTLRTAGKYLEGDITITASADVNNQNKTVIPSETTQSITADTGYTGLGTVTVNGITNTYVGSSVPTINSSSITANYEANNNTIRIEVSKGYLANKATAGKQPETILPTQSATTIIPSETDQTAVDIHKWTTGTVTVAAITPIYVGSSVPVNTSLTVAANTITAQAGYYADAITYTMPYAITTRPEFTTPTPTITINSDGLITSSQVNNGRINIGSSFITSSGYITKVTPTISMDLKVPSSTLQLPVQASTTVVPSESTTTITGQKYMTGDITVEPIPSQYIVPSGTLTITSVDTTTTFDATSYASINVNLKNADVTAY